MVFYTNFGLSSKKDVDVLVFPEYSVPAELLVMIEQHLLKESSDLIVVAGTHVVTNKKIVLPTNYPIKSDNLAGYAICPIINSTGLIEYVTKHKPSKWEQGLHFPDAEQMKLIPIKNCKIAIRICIDAIIDTLGNVDPSADLIIVPSYSPDTTPFESMANLAKYNEKPTVYANVAKMGGSVIYASFPSHGSQWFVENGHTSPVPRENECIVVSTINLDNKHDKKGSVYTPIPAVVNSVISIYHRRSDKQNELISHIDMLLKDDDTVSHFASHSLSFDAITAKKISWCEKRNEMGLLSKDELSSILDYLPINQMNYSDFINYQASELLKELGKHMNEVLSDSHAMKMLARLSSCLDQDNETPKDMIERYADDDSLFDGRSKEIGTISSFFNSQDNVLVCQGLRGIGKSKILQLLKPKIIPEDNPYLLYSVNLTPGSGYDFLVDELFYLLKSPVSDPSKKPPAVAANLFSDCIKRRQKSCIIIDDFHYLLDTDYTFYDERTKIFFDSFLSQIEFTDCKVIVATSRKINMFPYKQLEVSRLEQNVIKWIIEYCSSGEYQSIASSVDAKLIKAIHGNPLAAIIATQLLIENKKIPMPPTDDTFKRFEEQYIKNLMGELGLSENEQKVFEILSISDVGIEVDFILDHYPHLMLHVYKLADRFLIDVNMKIGLVSVHPLILDSYRTKTEVTASILLHREYATFMEKKHFNDISSKKPAPTIISQIIHHLAGGLELSKHRHYKGKYVDQLKPIADRLFKERKYEQAAENYLIMHEILVGSRPDITLKLVQCYAHTDNIKLANEYFELAVKAKPNTAYYYAKYAIALSTKRKNHQLAETIALQAEEIFKQYGSTRSWEPAEIKFALAQAISWGNPMQALSLYEQACSLDTTNSRYLVTYGRRLLDAGDTQGAAECHVKSVSINPYYRGNEHLHELIKQQNKSDKKKYELSDTSADFPVEN